MEILHTMEAGVMMNKKNFVSRVQRLACSDVDQGMMEQPMSLSVLPGAWRPVGDSSNIMQTQICLHMRVGVRLLYFFGE